MHGDGSDKETRGQVAGRDKEPLGEAGRRTHRDGTTPQPLGVEEESHALVHVGQQEVQDENEKLIRWLPRRFLLLLFLHCCLRSLSA